MTEPRDNRETCACCGQRVTSWTAYLTRSSGCKRLFLCNGCARAVLGEALARTPWPEAGALVARARADLRPGEGGEEE